MIPPPFFRKKNNTLCQWCVYFAVRVQVLNLLLAVAGLRWILLWSPSAFWLLLPSPSKSTDPCLQQGPGPGFTFKEYKLYWLVLFALRCVTASVSASASMTQQLLSGRAPRPKPFRVTNADRSVKKGIMADTLQDLMSKVRTEAAGVVEQAEE